MHLSGLARAQHLALRLTTRDSVRVVDFAVNRIEGPASKLPHAGFERPSHCAFGPDGMLYVGVGDAGDESNSQKLSNLNGKILRIDVESDTEAATALSMRRSPSEYGRPLRLAESASSPAGRRPDRGQADRAPDAQCWIRGPRQVPPAAHATLAQFGHQ